MKLAKYWERVGKDKVRCTLCPNSCMLDHGKRGVCGVRENKNGKLYSLVYGFTSSVCADPIEKKPLYHFYPGTFVLSFGTLGCNLRCKHCQNYEISQAEFARVLVREVRAENIADLIARSGCKGVAWTYNEPTIWYEFTLDASRHASEAGFYTVYVTNGYINEKPLRELAPYLDAMNIDVKSFRETHYREVCGGKLAPVLATAKLARELGIHVELTYLVIPGHNDSPAELREFCEWVAAELGKNTPVHFSRFFPHYKMTQLPPTPMATMMRAYEVALRHLNYVYLGNVAHDDYENTYCHSCRKLLIERHGFYVAKCELTEGKCKYCSAEIPVTAASRSSAGTRR